MTGSGWSARERIPTVVVNDPRELAVRVAHRIADVIKDRQRTGRPAVLGLATGSTPVDVYAELVRMHRDEGLSFRGVITFNLDEYYPMDPGNIHSYARYMREHLFDHVDIDSANVHIPRGDIPRAELLDACRQLRGGNSRRGRDRSPDPWHWQDWTHRIQRAWLGSRESNSHDDARSRHTGRRRRGFLRRGTRPPRGRDNGRGDNSRSP